MKMTKKAMAKHEKGETRATEKRETPAFERAEKKAGIEKPCPKGKKG
jgi:hypothetical protein